MTCALFAALILLADVGEGARTDLYGDPLPPGAVARLGTIRLLHAYADWTFSQDGKQLISCGCNGEVRLWDTATGKLVRRKRLGWKPHADEVLHHAALAPGGATATVWDGHTLFFFDTTTGKERQRLAARANTPFPSLRISPDGKIVVVEVFDFQKNLPLLRLWDTVERQVHHIRPDPSIYNLTSLVFAPDGRHLAGIGFKGEEVYLWDGTTGAEVRKPKDRATVRGRSVAFSPDGQTLAVSSLSDGYVHLLDAATWKEKNILRAPASASNHSIDGLAFSLTGQIIAGTYGCPTDARAEQGVLLWDMAGTKKARRLPEQSSSHLLFAPDGQTLACHDRGSELRLWDVTKGRQRLHRPGHDLTVHAVAISPDGNTLVSGDEGRTLRWWDSATGKPLYSLELAEGNLQQCFFSPSGRQVISVCDHGVIQLWDVATRKELRRFVLTNQVEIIQEVGISADGKRLLATAKLAAENEEIEVRLYVWDTDRGDLLIQRPYKTEMGASTVGLSGFAKWYRDHTVFAPDGATMSVWQGIVDVSTGRTLTSLPKGLGRPMAFSPDGRFLAAALVQPNEFAFEREDRKGLSLLETASGEELFRWDVGATDFVAFTPDGRGVIAADKENLRVWDTTTAARLYQRAWPGSIRDERGGTKVSSLAALPGGRVATGTAEGEILIWDLAAAAWPTHSPPGELSRPKLNALWSDLASDAHQAHRAIHTLAGAPAQAVPFLRDRIRPVSVDGKRIEKLLAELDSEQFTAREAAARELTRLHFQVEPLLRQALQDKPSLETRRRLQTILASPKRPSAESLRTLRAIAVLERIGTPEARRVLEKLSGGAASRETREAKSTLQRLNRR